MAERDIDGSNLRIWGLAVVLTFVIELGDMHLYAGDGLVTVGIDPGTLHRFPVDNNSRSIPARSILAQKSQKSHVFTYHGWPHVCPQFPTHP